jgi:tetratricopeptide (TPR) repeat protein
MSVPNLGTKTEALNANLQQAYSAFRAGQKPQAEALCYQILSARMGEPSTLHLLGVIANSNGQLDRAIAYIRRACLNSGAPAVAFSDLGEMLRQSGKAEEAEKFLRKSIALNNKNANAWTNLGVLLQQNGGPDRDRLERLREARECFNQAIILQPDYFEAYWNRGTLTLLQGEFEKAWPDFEWRKRKQGHNLQIPSSQPVWSGLEDISDKTILVHWEQGLGDTIQFCRYIEMLTHKARKVLFWPQKALQGLMRNTDIGSAEIVDLDDKSLQYDFKTPLMSLPVILRTTLKSIPSKQAYMKPDDERVEKLRAKIGSKGFKIGISWKGSSGPIDAGRSIPLTQFLRLLDIPEVRLISLQKFEGLYQLHSLPRDTKIETLGDDFDTGPDAFMDSAAAMSLCDLIITSDTAIAHLAGALGVPTWVALKQTPDWRWLLDRQDSPWYPSMRLYRQKRANNWDDEFEDIQADIKRVMIGEALSLDTPQARHQTTAPANAQPPSNLEAQNSSAPVIDKSSTPTPQSSPAIKHKQVKMTSNEKTADLLPMPQAPIAWGEFIDKLTILEIKSVKITERKALTHVLKELSQLFASADARWKTNEALLVHKDELRIVNETLWAIEDDIREKEAKKEFDDAFVQLARSVYQQNDRRASIKKAINNLMQSEISEEKLYRSYS